jgi:hypothetical protein
MHTIAKFSPSLGCLICFLGLEACAPRPHPDSLNGPNIGKTSSPIHYRSTDRRPYLKTRGRNKKQNIWLIDSGATDSALFSPLSNSLQNQIHIHPGHTIKIHGLFGVQSRHVKQFTFTSGEIPQISGYIIPKHSRSIDHADGIIGLNSLRTHSALLDVSSKILIWKAKTLSKTPAKIKLHTHSATGHFILTVHYKNTPLHFIIDSGARYSVISTRTATQLNIPSKPTHLTLSGLHASKAKVFKTGKITFTLQSAIPLHLNHLLVSELPTIQQTLNTQHTEQIDGILGYDFLLNHCQAIHFGEGVILLKLNDLP